jgi:hypothetical protein
MPEEKGDQRRGPLKLKSRSGRADQWIISTLCRFSPLSPGLSILVAVIHFVEVSSQSQILHLWGAPLLSVESPTHAHTLARGGFPTPNQCQNDVTEQHRALQVAESGGSCTPKEIIETGLFMLVGKGAWIWIKSCAHFANYPASVLKEKRASADFQANSIPSSPPLPIHTHKSPLSPHHHFFSSHKNNSEENVPLNVSHMSSHLS